MHLFFDAQNSFIFFIENRKLHYFKIKMTESLTLVTRTDCCPSEYYNCINLHFVRKKRPHNPIQIIIAFSLWWWYKRQQNTHTQTINKTICIQIFVAISTWSAAVLHLSPHISFGINHYFDAFLRVHTRLSTSSAVKNLLHKVNFSASVSNVRVSTDTAITFPPLSWWY